MRRLMIYTLAPISLMGLANVGCHSSADDAPPTVWNDKGSWGTQRAAQAGNSMDAGTAAELPPTTQPAK
jgi:hypothetical protein